MIITYRMLLEKYKNFKSPADKIVRSVKHGEYIKVAKGLYESNKDTPGYLLANAMYNPSYLSFEFALSYHGLIPEAVYVYTSATFNKKKTKKYTNYFGTYIYRDIPTHAYPFEILVVKEHGYPIQIASAEKALCDKLYTMKAVKNKQQLISLLFDDLRIHQYNFQNLDKDVLLNLCDLYPSTNLKLLKKVLR